MSHSKWSPSSGPREYACPPSHLLNRNRPRNDTQYNTYGTAGHHIAELCLTSNTDVDIYVGCRLAVLNGQVRFVHEKAPPLDGEFVHECDDKMGNAIQQYVDRCRAEPGDHYVEVQVEHTDWVPDTDEDGNPTQPQYGTSDFVACSPGLLVVRDLKMGQGLKVDAFENIQALKYALGCWKEYDWLYGFERVRIHIDQPLLDHFDSWEISVEELLEWGAKIKARAELCYDPDAEFGPGEKQCKFCHVAATCRAARDYVFAQRAMVFDDLDGEPVHDHRLLSDEELVEAWRLWPLAEMIHKRVDEEIKRRFYANNGLPGLKLIEGITHRAWSDEDSARETLSRHGVSRDKYIKETMVSPNAAEKLLKKEDREELSGFWRKPPGAPVIALASDKRPDYKSPVDLSLFDDDGFND